MPKFQIGDIVIGNDDAARYSITCPGEIGRVTGVSDVSIRIEPCDETGGRRVWRDGSRHGFLVRAAHFDLLQQPLLDVSKPVFARNGQPVKVIKTHDKDRPYTAVIAIKGKELTLSYDQYGRFVGHSQCPVDLINRE